MQYILAFRYILDRRRGFGNLMMLTVCMIIPIIGPIVLLGYQAEVAVDLQDDPDLRRHPRFKFDYFVEYLTRGVWPFLINLILQVFYVPVWILWIAVMMGNVAANPNGAPNPQMMLLVYPVILLVSMFITAFSAPMTFHAKLTGRFDLRGGLRFTLSFWMLVGGLAIVTGIIYVILSTVVLILGLLLCFVGVYPAAALIQMAQTHLMVQLYREYLDRGGEPLPEKHEPETDEDDYDFHSEEPRPRPRPRRDRDDDGRPHRIDRFDDEPEDHDGRDDY